MLAVLSLAAASGVDCDGGDASACMSLAWWLSNIDLERAAATLRRACQLSDEEGCLQLGLVMLDAKVHGRRRPDRSDSAASWLNRECAAGSETSCALQRLALATARASLR